MIGNFYKMNPNFSIYITISRKSKCPSPCSESFIRLEESKSTETTNNSMNCIHRHSPCPSNLNFLKESLDVKSSHHFTEIKNVSPHILNKHPKTKRPNLHSFKKHRNNAEKTKSYINYQKNLRSLSPCPFIISKDIINYHKRLQTKLPSISEKKISSVNITDCRSSYRKYVSHIKLSFEYFRDKSFG